MEDLINKLEATIKSSGVQPLTNEWLLLLLKAAQKGQSEREQEEDFWDSMPSWGEINGY